MSKIFQKYFKKFPKFFQKKISKISSKKCKKNISKMRRRFLKYFNGKKSIFQVFLGFEIQKIFRTKTNCCKFIKIFFEY